MCFRQLNLKTDKNIKCDFVQVKDFILKSTLKASTY
jgi:hypothetical protein